MCKFINRPLIFLIQTFIKPSICTIYKDMTKQELIHEDIAKTTHNYGLRKISDIHRIEDFNLIYVIDKVHGIITTYTTYSKKPYQYKHVRNMHNRGKTIFHDEITRDQLREEVLEHASKVCLFDSKSTEEAVKFLDTVCI